jgi:hypothetical protein
MDFFSTSAFFVQLITGNPFYKSELKSMQAADRYRFSYSHNRLFKPGGGPLLASECKKKV